MPGLSDKQSEEKIKRELFRQMEEVLMDEMTIESYNDPNDFTKSFIGTFSLGTVGTTSITTPYRSMAVNAAYDTSGSSHTTQIEQLRVVEYMKNGKVTRVELQRKDSHSGWKKIPRIQIEE
jgi:hypothetical protein